MNSNQLTKMIIEDAREWLAAEMFFGEGAGTRRKLLSATISEKAHTIPGYQEGFDVAYNGLDKSKFAEMAVKERKRIDAGVKAGKNFRALKSGNLHGLSNGVFVVVVGAYLLHATGYDKVIADESKKLYRKAKIEATVWRHRGGDAINLLKNEDE